ncbi:hypothetical protein CWR43_18740 [Rhizobium sullae]|uniref:Uncharacterized protein n=1 Tax=Rhizobium sullae TaxID=50338 RepID=A0A2N0D7V2_RHISU|nr:hypothetical protein CWR43_18740 [Rhizobium sullae]
MLLRHKSLIQIVAAQSDSRTNAAPCSGGLYIFVLLMDFPGLGKLPIGNELGALIAAMEGHRCLTLPDSQVRLAGTKRRR